MDEVVAQLKRIADAMETQDRFNQEWRQFNQEIQDKQDRQRDEDLARIREQQAAEDRRNQAREDRQVQELETAKQALQERIAALTSDEIKELAQHVLTGIFTQEGESNG